MELAAAGEGDQQGGSNYTTTTSSSSVSEEVHHHHHHALAHGAAPLLSDAQRLLANDVLLALRCLFLVLSLPVTVCNVLVFSRRRMRSATSVYILGLSAAQIFFLSAHVGLILWSGLHGDPESSRFFCLFELYAVGFGSVVARRGSYVILCFVSTERLCAILRPLHVKNFVLSKFSVPVMAATFAVTAVLHLYVPAKLVVTMRGGGVREGEGEGKVGVVGVGELEEGEGGGSRSVSVSGSVSGSGSVSLSGTSSCQPVETDLYLRHRDVNDGFSLVAKILMTYAALLLQILLNVLTVWALRRHNAASKLVHHPSVNEDEVRRRRQQERQLTVTILVTTVAYVALSLPACLNGLLNMLVPGYTRRGGGRYSNLAAVVHDACLDLQILSCSVDFVCFFALSSNYRKTFFRVFSACFGGGGGEGGGKGKGGGGGGFSGKGGGGGGTTSLNDVTTNTSEGTMQSSTGCSE